MLLEQSLVPLALSGLAVSPFGGSTFAVDSIPEYLSEDQVEKVVREILDRLALFGKRDQNEEILRGVPIARIPSLKLRCILVDYGGGTSPFNFATLYSTTV